MNKRRIVRVCVMVAVLLLTLAVALAAEEKKRKPRPSTYAVVRGGVFLPAGDWNDADWEPKANIELAVGYHFLPFLALECGFHRFHTFMSQVTTFYMDVKLYASGVELTAKLIYPVKRFEFYVGGGAGYWWVTEGTFVALPLGGSYGEVYDSLLGYHAVAGASFDVLRWLYLGLEGKYVFLPNFLDGGEIPGWGLTLGIGFRFL